MIKAVLKTLAFSILLAACTPKEDSIYIKDYAGTDLLTTDVDSLLQAGMEKHDIPGLAVAIINSGNVKYHKTIGYANKEKKLPVTDKTLFEGASMSKSVFATMVMMYVEEGKLDMDKPLYEYLPYPDIAYDERYKKITARMVLSHRSGLPNWREDDENKKLKIKFEPGSDYMYSGEGYQYLVMVLQHIDSTDANGLEKIFQDKIAKPLGLEHTVFIRNEHTRNNKAEPYSTDGAWIDKSKVINRWSGDEFGAAYSIHSEPIDFSRWMIAVMNRKLLREESYQQLFKPHSIIPSDGPMKLSYGLGFFIPTLPDAGSHLYGHSGHNDGFTCLYVLDAEKDWGVVIFTNSENGSKLNDELLEYLLKE
jgi:CubicO group peptidase (beta-lactamase class C family)